MVLKTKQTFDKVMLDRHRNPGDFLNYVAMGANRELVDKLVDRLRNHKLYIVRLSEPWTEDEDTYGTMAYRQDLLCDRMVQCDNCKYNPDKPHKYYNDDLIYSYIWCPKFIEDLNGKGFCPYGKEYENA